MINMLAKNGCRESKQAILIVNYDNNDDNDIGTVDCGRCISNNSQRIALLFAQPAGGSNGSQM